MTRSRPGFIPLALVGIAAGVLSGLFGIGGGTLIVPALALWLGMNHRLAAGTSVAAILPTAIVGAVSYAVPGNVDWIAAILLAVGIIAGAQLGSHLLDKLPLKALQWGFMVFLAVMAVSLWFVVPQRGDQIELGLLSGAGLVFTGLFIGVLSGLLGVGGGVVVVPVLMFFFGSSDLIAKGTSLLMMIPGSLSGTFANLRRQNVDLRAAAIVGIAASICVPFSSLFAAWIDPFWGNVAFSLYLVFILGQMLYRQLRPKRG
ncbi:MAG: TSUP family transporter [Leucobacter sp.]|nr:TSUP family transporter [Leucobacter sp.]